jgi:hypothetical protein
MPLSIIGVQRTIEQIHDILLKMRELPVDLIKNGDEYSIICCMYRPKTMEFKFDLYSSKVLFLLKKDNQVKKEINLTLDKMFSIDELNIISKMAFEWCLNERNVLLCKEV